MHTQTPPFRTLIVPIAFAVVCVLVTIFMYRAFNGTTPLDAHGYRFSVPVESAANLFEGSEVQISGLKVGEVVAVKHESGGATALVEMDSEYAPVRVGTRAILRLKTLVGEGYLDLTPGPKAAAPVPDGGTLAADQVQPSLRLDDFLSTFDPSTRKRMRSLFAGLADSLEGREQDLNRVLAEAAPFATRLEGLLSTLAGQRQDLHRLVANSATLYGALGSQQGALQAAVRSGNEMLDVTAERNESLAATVDELPPFLRQLRATSDTVTGLSPELNRAVKSLVPVAPHL